MLGIEESKVQEDLERARRTLWDLEDAARLAQEGKEEQNERWDPKHLLWWGGFCDISAQIFFWRIIIVENGLFKAAGAT